MQAYVTIRAGEGRKLKDGKGMAAVMNVNGLRANGYGTAYMEQGKRKQSTEAAQKTGQFASDYAAQAAGKTTGEGASYKWNVTCSASNVVLHGDSAEGEEAVTAWANVVTGTSMTVYKPKDFDPENPVYKVKMWEESGKETECMVDISKVNPADCNVMEMFAYSAHLSSSGEYPGALEQFIMTQAHHRDSIADYSAKNLFDKTNWLKVIKEVMQMQYNAGNLKGYLEYKGFLGFLTQKTSEKKEKENSSKEETQVNTDIQVNPDGSRVLVMTRRIGGMATTTSIEISKPTKLPNNTAVHAESRIASAPSAGWSTSQMEEKNLTSS